MSSLRTLLILGRPAYLPTVWSNVLVGWWLGGAEHTHALPLLMLGTTLLYFGGAYLNDTFDYTFDCQHRRNYPIPSGLISFTRAWRLGVLWLVLGVAALYWADAGSGTLGLALGLWTVAYNASHRILIISPLLLGFCRLFLYLIGAAASAHGITGWAIWAGLAASFYATAVAGVFPYGKSLGLRRWYFLLLGVPLVLAFVMNGRQYFQAGLLLSLVLALWCLRSIRPAFSTVEAGIAQAPSGLIAGMVLVDWLAAADAPRGLSAVFICLFLLALLIQQLSPEPRGANP